MKELLEKLAKDVEKIREDQVELIKQGAIHNELLKTHEARSLALQEDLKLTKKSFELEMQPIKSHVSFINNIAKIIAFIGGSVSVIYYGLSIFTKFFH